MASAAGFRALPDSWIQKEMTVVGLRTARELRGRPCLELELVRPDRKTLVRSRSFGKRVTSKKGLRQSLYRSGYGYKEASVLLNGIRPSRPHQESLFGRGRREDEDLMRTVDRVNRKHGKGAIRLAAAGLPEGRGQREWKMKRQYKPPRYTTRWDELPVARAGRPF